MRANLVVDALKMALFCRGLPEEAIVHSDRGSQDRSKSYREIINYHNLKQSMSRKGNCWDTVCVESFFHSLKVEAIQYEGLFSYFEASNIQSAIRFLDSRGGEDYEHTAHWVYQVFYGRAVY